MKSNFRMLLVLALLASAAEAAEREVLKAKSGGKPVPEKVMKEIYEQIKTPYKYGVVLKGQGGELVDCPNVFRHGGKWYMMYVSNPGPGYETWLAASDDLLQWKTLGRNFTFPKTGWDAWQADTSIALYDHAWGGSHELQKYDGKYWVSYIGGALQGYEPDPLAIGMAWSIDPASTNEWKRIAGNPVLSREQADVRPFEKTTLYKSTIIWDKQETLGYPFVMYYNGKRGDQTERIGMAVSKDMTHWIRYGTEPVIDNGSGNSGDPQITRIGDVWVMIYYGAFWKPKAFDTFACSYDLVTWTKWSGPHLTEPSVAWDDEFAHKPWVVFHKGVVYHFYCAVGNQGRVIAVATSRDMKK